MSDETTEQIEPTDETLEQMSDRDLLLALVRKVDSLENKLDKFQTESNVQFEAIRAGIAASHIAFERLTAKVYLISANLTEMQEQAQHSKETVI